MADAGAAVDPADWAVKAELYDSRAKESLEIAVISSWTSVAETGGGLLIQGMPKVYGANEGAVEAPDGVAVGK